MDDTNFVVDRLVAGEAFFFAGSGISYASNLPSAYAVLEHTVNVFLPTSVNNKEKKDICARIQPEVFYESIIGMTQTYECLDIWRSLYKFEQEKHGLLCSPNFAHLFIVEYSRKNNVPIITTNFDSMFEQACDLLDIKYDILLPNDSPPNVDSKVLSICKVHGSIQNMRGEYSPNTLWTTMTQITKVNTKWIEYLNILMTKKHLCFVGYSGRDIDFFPYIAEFPKKSGVKNIIWINRFNGDHSDIASKTCGATRACLWPTELFESIASNVNVQPAQNNQLTNDDSTAVERLLCSLEESLAERKLLTDEEKELLYCGVLAKLGHYRDAHRYATELESTKLSQFSCHHSKHLLLLTCARLSHEISRYESCKKYAKQVLAILKSKGGYEINAALQANCLVSEANRMSIPNDIYFGQPKKIDDYFHVLFVVVHFILTTFTSKARMFYHKLRYSDLSVETQHELIEHRIRFWALIQSIMGSPQRGWNKIWKAFLVRIWDIIRDAGYQAGYSAGIANSGKFKYRLIPLEKTRYESSNIYSLTTSATGTELLLRNEADQLLRDGEFDESRKRFIDYADMARKSGNILNEIKGIIGFAYASRMEGKEPLLTEGLRNRFSILITEVEGKRWKDHFAYISTILLAGTKNT
jgi:hypothetical protein